MASATLPRPRTRAFGREASIESVRTLFLDGARLVTITGTGGIGKTRLAVEAAAQIDLPVEFVALAETDADGLLGELVRRLAPSASSGLGPLDAIVEMLSGRPTLLVLDTFEHLQRRVDVVSELLNRCGQLRVLATSRARLRLSGEHVVPLAGLTTARDGPAVAMFLDRAGAVGGQAAGDDASVIATVCEQLGGVPLAIELAAARTPMLTPTALLSRIRADASGRMLGVLARGPADAAQRHRSMSETIEWSYVLLDPAAQLVMRRCSVFPASFGLDAAEYVCGLDVLDEIAALVDLHLVDPVDGPAGTPRFRMLDAIREYAASLLADSAERDATRARLDGWCELFAADAGAGLLGADERNWLEQVEVELPSLRVVLGHLTARCETRRGLVLAARIAPFWLHRGPMSEGRSWLTSLLAQDNDADAELDRAVALGWAGRLSLDENDLTVVDDLAKARELIGRHPEAVTEWLQATEHLAYALTLRGELTSADELTAEAAARAAKEELPFWLAVFRQRRALSAERRGDLALAAQYAEETIAVAGAIGYERVVARAEQILAHVRGAGVDQARAHAMLMANLEAHRASGDARGVVIALAGLGLAWERADPAAAARWYSDGLDEAHRIGYWHGEAYCVLGIADTAALARRWADAAALDASLQPHYDVLTAGLPAGMTAEYRKNLADTRSALGEEGFHAARVDAPTHWPNVRRMAVEVADRLGASIARTEPEPAVRRRGPRANPDLTDREQQILAAIVAGETNPQIAARLGLSAKTVMHHSSSVYRKLAVRGRAEAIARVYRSGIPPGAQLTSQG